MFAKLDNTDIEPNELDFSGIYIGDKGVVAICNAVATIRRLQSISFRGGYLEEGAVRALCDSFKTHPHISSIDITDNHLYASSGRLLIGLLLANPRIHTLKVDTNEMPQRVAKALQVTISRNYKRCFPELPQEDLPEDDYRSSIALDRLLMELHHPHPDDIMLAIQERVVHHWYLVLGDYAVQYMADYGINTSSNDFLQSIITQYFSVPIEPSPNEVAGTGESMRRNRIACPVPLNPLEAISNEVAVIAAAVAISTSPLSFIADLRGRTIRAQIDTCVRLVNDLKVNESAFIEIDDVMPIDCDGGQEPADYDTMTAVVSDHNSLRKITKIDRLLEVLYLLRNALANISTSDVIEEYLDKGSLLLSTGALQETEESRYDDVMKHQRQLHRLWEFESAIYQEIQHDLLDISYESTRKLSLVCDSMRYWSMNNKEVAAAITARGGNMVPGESKDYENALKAYRAAVGDNNGTCTATLSPIVAYDTAPPPTPQRERIRLLCELQTLVSPNLYKFLHYLGISWGLCSCVQPLWRRHAKLISPFYYWVAPQSCKINQQLQQQPPKVSRIADDLERLRKEDSLATAEENERALGFDAVVGRKEGLSDGKDVLTVLGNVHTKYDLSLLGKQYTAYRRYMLLLEISREDITSRQQQINE